MLQFQSQAYSYFPRALWAAAEMAEQQENPNPNEFQLQVTMLDYEDLVPLELTHRIASGNADAAAREKKVEAPELLDLSLLW